MGRLFVRRSGTLAIFFCLCACAAPEAEGAPETPSPPSAPKETPTPPEPPAIKIPAGATAADPAPAGSKRNLFVNPSFEQGREPWWSFAGPKRPYWADFSLSTEHAHSGHRAGRLDLTSVDYSDTKRIYGVIQEAAPGEMPKRLAGWYRVEDWTRGARNQYLQVVIIVWDPKGVPATSTNIQISYVLAGITAPPFRITNRRFVFLGGEEPVQGEWVYFETDLHEDFRKHYGAVPSGFSKLRVLYEVRFDGRTPDDDDARATVYYDDLYLGP